MLQKNGEPNALNFFGIRKVSKPLPHFTYMQVRFDYGVQDKLDDWIRIHLKGRFYTAKMVQNSQDKKVEYAIKIGFEDAKELTLFTLGCPYIINS